MKKVQVAVIGAGGLANTMHYPSLAAMDDVNIAGICDLNDERLATTAERFSIRETFSDYHEMMEKIKPDAVYALMPPYMLFDVAMDVLESGTNLFVEKPPAVTTHQTECLARVADKRGLITGVGFQRRYHPMTLACWEETKKGGPIHQVVSCFYKSTKPDEEKYPYYRGAIDILRCDAIHAVDAMRFYCGLSEVKSVASEVRSIDTWYNVSFNSLVYFENGSVGVLLVNWRTGKRMFKFEFHSSGASAYVDIDATGEVWMDNGDKPVFSNTASGYAGSEEAYIQQGFRAESRAFIDAVKTGTGLHNSIQDSVKTMKLADMIFENAINK